MVEGYMNSKYVLLPIYLWENGCMRGVSTTEILSVFL